MAVPTVQEFNDGKRDLDDLEGLINGFITVATRLGGNKESYSQLVAKIVHGDITTYSAASTYTDVDEWVEESGIVYRPLPSALPIGPEVFDASKWIVVQGYKIGDKLHPGADSYAELQAITTTGLADNTPIQVRYRASELDGGGGTFHWDSSNLSAKVTLDPEGGVYVPPNSDATGASGSWVRRKNGSVVIAEWFGAIADWNGSTGTDNSVPINAAMVFCSADLEKYNTVLVGVGEFALESPIPLYKGVNFFGSGTLVSPMQGTSLVCNFSAGTISAPPTDNFDGERFFPTFDYTPMLYNVELLTQQGIGNFRLNGNLKDVYGIYLNDWFFMNNKTMHIIRCNKSPITCVVGQFNRFELLTIASNSAGARFIGCDTTQIDLLDTEANSFTGSLIDIVQDVSSKTSVTINDWHHEETNTLFTTILAQISGRGVAVNGSSFGMGGSSPIKYVEFIGATTYNFDGESFTTIEAIGCEFNRHSFSASTGAFRFNSGAVGNFVNTTSTLIDVDNSGNVTNRTEGLTAAPAFPRGTKITDSAGDTHLFFSDDDTINFFNNANRRITKSGAAMTIDNLAGNLDITSSGRLNLSGDTDIDLDGGGQQSARIDGSTTGGNTRLLIWDVDNNALERVTVGSADSGGAGFKVLRIPN